MPRTKTETQPQEGPRSRFEDYLRTHGLRMTSERMMVLDVILSHEGHFDAEDLLRFLRRRRKAVSRATLYRTLEHLQSAGLVNVHRFGKGHALYEHVYGRKHHDHMICNHCDQVIEFVNDDIERLQEEMCRRHRFHSTNHVMQIFGICAECRKLESEEHSSMKAGA